MSIEELEKLVKDRKKIAKNKEKHAFLASDLSVLAYANNFTQWHYITEGNQADIEKENYFKYAVDMLRVGDVVITNTTKDRFVIMYMVTVNDGNNIKISPIN